MIVSFISGIGGINPADTRRNNNVFIASKRRRRRRFNVMKTLSFRHYCAIVSGGTVCGHSRELLTFCCMPIELFSVDQDFLDINGQCPEKDVDETTSGIFRIALEMQNVVPSHIDKLWRTT